VFFALIIKFTGASVNRTVQQKANKFGINEETAPRELIRIREQI